MAKAKVNKEIAKLDYDYIKYWVIPIAALVILAVSIRDSMWQGAMIVISFVVVAIWLYELNSKYKCYRESLK